MISLFIDTSLKNVSVSIIKDDKILALITDETPNMHSVYATSFVKKAIDMANIDANQVDNIMVINGPGSFTGVRIGVTIAKTYGYLIKREVTPISSLKSMAISSKYDGNVMSLISARRNNYYMGLYDKDMNEIMPETFIDGNKIQELILKYNPMIVSNEMSVLGVNKIHKVDLDVLKIVNYYKDKEKINYHKLVPNYLKLPQVLEK